MFTAVTCSKNVFCSCTCRSSIMTEFLNSVISFWWNASKQKQRHHDKIINYKILSERFHQMKMKLPHLFYATLKAFVMWCEMDEKFRLNWVCACMWLLKWLSERTPMPKIKGSCRNRFFAINIIDLKRFCLLTLSLPDRPKPALYCFTV